ncbi:MAG: aminotransferase class V-fold PLP-dependent enzyme [Malacoplasma sp.]
MNNIRNKIDWFINNKDYIYFDSAATSLKPREVIEKVKEYVDKDCTNSHNTDSAFSYKVIQVINETRQLLSDYIGCDASNIVFTPGATYSLNTVASAVMHFLNDGDEILLTNAEHSSNILPWYDLRSKKNIKIEFANYDDFLKDKDDDYDIYKKINDRTKIVSFANSSNLFGKVIDAIKIAKRIKEINPNVLICIDATQFLAHNKICLQGSGIDFLVGSAHKMFGPTGIGFLYMTPNLMERLIPNILGGGMNNQIRRDYYSYAKGYHKFEAGTPNLMGIYGWNAALKIYNEIDIPNEKKRIYELKKYLDENLSRMPGFKIFNAGMNSFITLFAYENVFSQDLAAYFGKNKIILRSGLSCAKLSDELINQEHAVRLSMHFYTTKEDVDMFLKHASNYRKGDELNDII